MVNLLDLDLSAAAAMAHNDLFETEIEKLLDVVGDLRERASAGLARCKAPALASPMLRNIL